VLPVATHGHDPGESKRKTVASGVTGFRLVLLTAASCAVGFVMGVEWLEKAFRKEFAKRTRFP
jgi:hypothetical protein